MILYQFASLGKRTFFVIIMKKSYFGIITFRQMEFFLWSLCKNRFWPSKLSLYTLTLWAKHPFLWLLWKNRCLVITQKLITFRAKGPYYLCTTHFLCTTPGHHPQLIDTWADGFLKDQYFLCRQMFQSIFLCAMSIICEPKKYIFILNLFQAWSVDRW